MANPLLRCAGTEWRAVTRVLPGFCAARAPAGSRGTRLLRLFSQKKRWANKKRWTSEDDQQFVDLWAKGIPGTEIAQTLDRSYPAIRTRAYTLKLEKRSGLWPSSNSRGRRGIAGKRWTSEDDQHFADLWAKGISGPEIAQTLKRSCSAIRLRAVTLKLEKRSGPSWDTKTHRKLLELWVAGKDSIEIAEALNRSIGSVQSQLYLLRVETHTQRWTGAELERLKYAGRRWRMIPAILPNRDRGKIWARWTRLKDSDTDVVLQTRVSGMWPRLMRKEIFRLRYEVGLTFEEIAKRIRRSKSSLEYLFSRPGPTTLRPMWSGEEMDIIKESIAHHYLDVDTKNRSPERIPCVVEDERRQNEEENNADGLLLPAHRSQGRAEWSEEEERMVERSIVDTDSVKWAKQVAPERAWERIERRRRKLREEQGIIGGRGDRTHKRWSKEEDAILERSIAGSISEDEAVALLPFRNPLSIAARRQRAIRRRTSRFTKVAWSKEELSILDRSIDNSVGTYETLRLLPNRNIDSVGIALDGRRKKRAGEIPGTSIRSSPVRDAVLRKTASRLGRSSQKSAQERPDARLVDSSSSLGKALDTATK